MLNFNSILIFSENPEKLGDFYKKIFQKDPEMEDGGYFGFLVGNGFITIGPHDKVHGKNTHPEGIMFNLDTQEVEEEFKRIEKIGAKVVAKPYSPMEDSDALIATFEDLDGNFFQLNTPWNNNTN